MLKPALVGLGWQLGVAGMTPTTQPAPEGLEGAKFDMSPQPKYLFGARCKEWHRR